VGYADADGDGWAACDDCDDLDAAVHPDAVEVCDGLDNDCDSLTDDADDSLDAGTLTDWYADLDGDGYGDPAGAVSACEAPVDHVAQAGDCDDADPSASPLGVELCDGADQDCDGEVDEDAVDPSTWYYDGDGDGWGDPGAPAAACDAPPDHVDNDGDCDDGEYLVSPDRQEVCDGVDNDCDALVDDADGSVDPATGAAWYVDSDGDGYGAGAPVAACDAPPSHAGVAGDCDDGDAAVNPDGTEVCDGLDNDCDGDTDGAAVDASSWYADGDGDGYGDADAAISACAQPADHVGDATDCDDTSAVSFPGAEELCDGLDNDCDGDVDPACGPDGQVDLGDADAKLIGEEEYDLSSSWVAGVGDVDGDGADDFFIGAYGEDSVASNSGAAYLVLSAPSGQVDLADADAKLTGVSDEDWAGWMVSGAGDVNNDGYDDLLVGAPKVDDAGSDAGAAYLVLGPTTGTSSLADADGIFTGEAANDWAGMGLNGAGDVNDDGYDDFLVGAPYDDQGGSNAGATYLVLGPVGGEASLGDVGVKLRGNVTYDYAGRRMDGAGDVDGDGFDDVLVSAYYEDSGGAEAGAVHLFYGPVSADMALSSSDAKLVGEVANDIAGVDVAGAGDIDGDGDDDILIGAMRADAGAGRSYLVLDAVTGTRDLSAADAILYGVNGGSYSGNAVNGAGDMDGDGYGEVVIGAYYDSAVGSGTGSTYLLFGPVSGGVDLADADVIFHGENDGDYTGFSVGAAGDLDGDGRSDLLVSGYLDDTGGTSAGATYLFYGWER